jgi:hypothetical protein
MTWIDVVFGDIPADWNQGLCIAKVWMTGALAVSFVITAVVSSESDMGILYRFYTITSANRQMSLYISECSQCETICFLKRFVGT